MFTGLERVPQPKGVNITVNLTDWKEVAHSLRILANSFEELEYKFMVGSVGRVESPDGSSCGGWVVTEEEVR